ncbi:hypothetical protein [Agrococcus jejuensis]|uniref:Alpha/beta hydrolase family protein n=1 Tax=Agrococcus jejuensis TaxID=399736 RepID=A0A1G8D544_9MICO|nr:hypothetical protein [Agrococcus jejuensis]SDH52897.1 hypothetical protein SAMN04489720_1522 [Agrococcus jejuensis]
MTVVGWSPDGAAVVRARLAEVRDELERAQSRLRTRTWPSAAALSIDDAAVVAGVQALADDAEAACGLAIGDLDRLGVAVDLAGWSYQTTDAVVRGAVDWAADRLSVGLGVATRAFVTAAVGGLGIAVVGAGVLLMPLVALAARNPHVLSLAGGAIDAASRLAAPLLQGLQSLVQQHGPDLVNHPVFVDALRLAMAQLDDVGAGFALLPGSPWRDDHALGAGAMVATLLGLVVTGHAPRLPGSTPVTIERGATGAVQGQAPAASYTDAFARIQSMESNVEIDRYELADGTVVYQVFAGGTQEFAFDHPDTAYDMTSNTENAMNVEGGETFGSADAVLQAMEEAGIGEGDVVQMFGYSQGGAAVAGAALGAGVSVHSVVTFAGPVGRVAVPEGTMAVAVQNDSDVVSALAGPHVDDRLVLEGSPNLDEITTRRYDDAGQPLSDLWVGGHYPEAYWDTAQQLDALDDDVVDAVWAPVETAQLGPIEVESAGWDVQR